MNINYNTLQLHWVQNILFPISSSQPCLCFGY